MTLRVLIIPDKFKGTLTAAAATTAIAKGWHQARPRDRITLLPMSDGGDGFGEIFGRLLQAERYTAVSVDAAHRRCRLPWWFAPARRLAIIESANVIGLAMLPRQRRRPLQLDTFGLGEVLKSAARMGARQCLLGIGGSATNDGGFGLARSLGWHFIDSNNQTISRWTDLVRLSRIEPPARSALGRMRITVATDVQNPLLGKRGATRVYGPQKGLGEGDLAAAERSLRRLAAVVAKLTGHDHASSAGAGAAGGLGFGLFAFAGGRAKSGVDLFARYSDLQKRLRDSDLVITGEGRIDSSTLMGKGVGDVARLCRRSGIPCLGLAGTLKDETRVRRIFTVARSMTPGLATRAQALEQPAFWLSQLARRVGEDWSRRSD